MKKYVIGSITNSNIQIGDNNSMCVQEIDEKRLMNDLAVLNRKLEQAENISLELKLKVCEIENAILNKDYNRVRNLLIHSGNLLKDFAVSAGASYLVSLIS